MSITVLPADDPNKKKLGWVMYELKEGQTREDMYRDMYNSEHGVDPTDAQLKEMVDSIIKLDVKPSRPSGDGPCEY